MEYIDKNMSASDEDEVSLFDIFGVLKKHIVFIVVLSLIGGIGAFVFSLSLPNEYTASATMYVLSRDETGGSEVVTQQDMSVGQMITYDVVTLINSGRVKKGVAERVGLTNLNDYKFNVDNTTNTRVITLSVTGKDPESTAQIANATVEEVSSVASEVMHVQSVNSIDSATVPSSPSGPKRLTYGAVGLGAGLLLAVAIVVVRDMLDTRVRSGDEAEKLVGVPVVGHFPAIES